jgi:hypothetical protein
MLPHPDRHNRDVQRMQMLRELRAQGHNVVHVARGGINRQRYAAGVEDLGIRVFSPDAERTRFLGFDFPLGMDLRAAVAGKQGRSHHPFPLVLERHFNSRALNWKKYGACLLKTFIAALTARHLV